MFFMVHEGEASQPQQVGASQLMRNDSESFYRERIMISNNPTYVIHLDAEDVAKQFGINVDECKYKQYIALPICYNNSNVVKFLFEINIIDEYILENDEKKVKRIINTYIKPIMDCFVLMMEIQGYVETAEGLVNKGVSEDEQTKKYRIRQGV